MYYKEKKSPLQQQTFGSLEWSYTLLHEEEKEGGDDETSL